MITEIQDNKMNMETFTKLTVKKEHQEPKDTTEAKTSREDDKQPTQKEVKPNNIVSQKSAPMQ